MKTTLSSLGLLLAALVAATPLAAQTAPGSPRENLDRQPAWGPSGYPLAEYYYIPAVDAYYDVERALFYTAQGSRWTASQSLPATDAGTNLYACYKVVMNGREPWRNHHNHTFAYERYRTRRFTQPTIGRDTATLSPAADRRTAKGKHNPRRQR